MFSHNYLFEILITYHKIFYFSYYCTLICINLKVCLLTVIEYHTSPFMLMNPSQTLLYNVVCFALLSQTLLIYAALEMALLLSFC